MVNKLLAWIAVGLSLAFVGVTLAGMLAFDLRQAENLQLAKTLFYWAAAPALGLAIVLAVVLLVVSAFQAKD